MTIKNFEITGNCMSLIYGNAFRANITPQVHIAIGKNIFEITFDWLWFYLYIGYNSNQETATINYLNFMERKSDEN